MSSSLSSVTGTFDKNLACTQVAMAAIDTVQAPYGDENTASEKSRTMLIATLGPASPAMTASAMLLLYQVSDCAGYRSGAPLRPLPDLRPDQGPGPALGDVHHKHAVFPGRAQRRGRLCLRASTRSAGPAAAAGRIL